MTMRRTLIFAACAAAAAGTGCDCGGGGGASDSAPGTDASGGSDAVATGADAASDAAMMISPACLASAPVPPADETRMMLWDGAMRTYEVHVPPGYDHAPTPVVFNFHGFTSNASDQAGYSEMIPKSDAAGFIAVHPQGLNNSWNAGDCCGQSATDGVDDVGFVGAMIDALAADLCVDEARVFATGLSNGGFLSYRLACELSDRIAAIAPVAGQLGVDPCAAPRPVPVIHFHGDADPIVPYDGSVFLGFVSVAESIGFWVTRNNCDPTPVETFNTGDTHCDTYGSCDEGADVVLCTITGGGHTWPGGTVPGGYTGMDLDATDAEWDFFVAHPMPPGGR